MDSRYPGFNPFLAISALAGSGKTYQLSSRYIALLAMGVAPSSILAITFTRKAAGEIFDRVVRRLAAAARNDKARRELETSLRKELGPTEKEGQPPFSVTAEGAQEWLRVLMAAMPNLRISTIDSLFASILKAFAVEFNVPSAPKMLEGARLALAREEALARAFLQMSLEKDKDRQQAFLEAFKLASSGEAKNARSAILEVIESGHEMYRDAREAGAWGEQRRIWPGTPWWDDAEVSTRERVMRCADDFERGYLSRCSGTPGYQNAWIKILNCIRENDVESALKGALPERILPIIRDPQATEARVPFGSSKNDFILSGEDFRQARALMASCVRTIFRRMLDETKGMHGVLEAYDHGYEEDVLRKGWLAFSDMTRLLGADRPPELTLDVNYRLDGRVNHWLLDEFQDTSFLQWRVIQPLAEEVLQSESGRSFFYVGDVKQAIYGWRGGKSTLFEEVQRVYQSRFRERMSLNTSWRSSPVVLQAVNQTFQQLSDANCLRTEYRAAAEEWDRRWQAHEPAERNRDLPGRVELYEVEEDPAGADGDSPCIEQACRIVQRLHAQGVRSIGALVRHNKFGDQLADALRRRGLPVRREAAPNLMDNGVVSALVSMLTMADHPADPFALPHLRATPLWTSLVRWMNVTGGPAADDRFFPLRCAGRLREVAAREGVSGLLERVLEACGDDAALRHEFIRLRLHQLLDAALEFDRHEHGSPSAFARLVASLEVRDPGAEGHIVVTTIHKAKGLEYDAVVLSDLQGSRRQLDFTKPGSLKMGGPASGASHAWMPSEATPETGDQWVLPMPSSKLAGLDPTLDEFVGQVKNLRVAEELCLLYVAMTRARQGLYLVTEIPGKTGKAVYPSTLLREKLSNLNSNAVLKDGLSVRTCYEAGDPDWPSKTDTGTKDEIQGGIHPNPFEPSPPAESGVYRRLAYLTPSGEEKSGDDRPAHLLFSEGKTMGSGRGNILHDLFSRIQWHSSDAGAGALKAHEREQGACPREIREEFLRALDAPDIIRSLASPGDRAEVWREQAFEWADEREWVSGRMDRVVIERDTTGRPVSATVMDFKSDRVGNEKDVARITSQYAPQVARYRNALSRMLGLAPEKIRACLILTHPAAVKEMPLA